MPAELQPAFFMRVAFALQGLSETLSHSRVERVFRIAARNATRQ
jgi:hypothetical protein